MAHCHKINNIILNSMTTFKEYIEDLRETVIAREPLNDSERGFKIAVMLVHEHYKKYAK